MPRASPIANVMLMTKKDRWNTCPTTAAMPRETTIETTAIISGTEAATTAPNTSSSTISAAGRPY